MTIVERAKRILTQPRQEWEVIEAEPATPSSLYMGYVAPLAAIGPVATAIGLSVFGVGAGAYHYRLPVGMALRVIVAQYLGALVATFVLALVVDALAPHFGGRKDRTQALKLAAYSSTAAWLAGAFAILPVLGVLGLLGLYSLFLLWTGLPSLMKAPQEKATPYAVAVVVAAIVIMVVTGAITSRIA